MQRLQRLQPEAPRRHEQYRVSFRSLDIVVVATEAATASLPDVLTARRALEAWTAALTEDDLADPQP